jgi:hypothetical protein
MMEIFSEVNVMPVNFSIRPVKMNDVQGIQRVAQLTWNHTYGTIYTDDFINSFLEQAYSNNSIEATISRDEKREIRKFMVAESESGIIGYAQLTVTFLFEEDKEETKDGQVVRLNKYVKQVN